MPADLELGDAERQALADVRGQVLDELERELRGGAEGPRAGDLHLDAALDHARDVPLHREVLRERLFQRARAVHAAAVRDAEQQGAAVGVDAADGHVHRVADPHREVAVGVGQLRDVDDRVGLDAEADVDVLAADRRDRAVDAVADLRRARRLAALPTLELAEEGAEVFVLCHGVRRAVGRLSPSRPMPEYYPNRATPPSRPWIASAAAPPRDDGLSVIARPCPVIARPKAEAIHEAMDRHAPSGLAMTRG